MQEIKRIKSDQKDVKTAEWQQRVLRIKSDPVLQCNKRSNEDQFKARKAVTEAVEDAKAALGTKLGEIGEKLAELAQNSALKSIRKATETNDRGL